MTAPAQAVDPAVIANLAKRFSGNARTGAAHAKWAAWAAKAAEPPTPPWELIREVLNNGIADGLDSRQLAGGLYAVLVAKGLPRRGGHERAGKRRALEGR